MHDFNRGFAIACKGKVLRRPASVYPAKFYAGWRAGLASLGARQSCIDTVIRPTY